MYKTSLYRVSFGNQRGNGSENLLKYARQHFCPLVSSYLNIFCWETSHFLRSQVLGLFINTLTTDDKYSRRKSENFTQLIQIQICKKPKTLAEFPL